MEINSSYYVLFVPGTGGHFIRALIYYYNYNDFSKIKINPVTGDCHNNNGLGGHYINSISSDNTLILIDFDNDDKKTIIKMFFNKFLIPAIKENPAWLSSTDWDIPSTDLKLLEQTLQDNPKYVIFPNWREQVTKLTPALTIKFKDIMFGNLNEIIANFLHKPQSAEAATLINHYQNINKKYLDIF
jgi:hypothetical protein